MSVISFPWDAQLVSIRRETAPRARWDKATRAWSMTAAEATAFLEAAQARLYFARSQCTITIDGIVWMVGFTEGTPYRLAPSDPEAADMALPE